MGHHDKRHGGARNHEDVLDPMVRPGDTEVMAKARCSGGDNTGATDLSDSTIHVHNPLINALDVRPALPFRNQYERGSRYADSETSVIKSRLMRDPYILQRQCGLRLYSPHNFLIAARILATMARITVAGAITATCYANLRASSPPVEWVQCSETYHSRSTSNPAISAIARRLR